MLDDITLPSPRGRARCAALFALSVIMPPGAAAAADLERLQAELEALKQTLSRMQHLEARVERLERELAHARAQRAAAGVTVAAEVPETGSGEGPPAASAPAPLPSVRDQAPRITLGGAARFNLFFEDFEEVSDRKIGDSAFDMIALSADGAWRDVSVSAEYRLYPFMEALHHAWLGYDMHEAGRLELGVTKVPFGLLPFSAHNYWLGVDYYLGLADDYDLGAKYVRQAGPWDLRAAFFKNEELGSATNLERYSFDVSRAGAGANGNEETNQINLRLAYALQSAPDCTQELGVSGMYGQLFNDTTRDSGDRFALAGHLDARCGRWHAQLEAGRYEFHPDNPAGVGDRTIRLGGFGGTHDVTSQGTIAVANLAYNIPVQGWPWLEGVTCYNDYSVLLKDGDAEDSMLNTTGCSFQAGPVYAYLDLIQARNMIFFSDGSLAGAGNEDWDLRLNLNIGYYY